MSLRIPVVLALADTAGAFLWLDRNVADTAAPVPAAANAMPAATSPAPAPGPVTEQPAARGWFADVPSLPPAAAHPGPRTIRKAADVVSGLPPVRAIHPSLVGKVSSLPPRTLEQRPGDRVEQRRVEARNGDALAPRYGDAVSSR